MIKRACTILNRVHAENVGLIDVALLNWDEEFLF